MKITDGKLPGVKLICPDIHEDFRGSYVMTYNAREYAELNFAPVENCISISSKGVLRGIHVDPECNKLIYVTHGRIYYVVVDLATGEYENHILSGGNHVQIFKPKQYGAGFLALTDDVVFCYMQDRYYDPSRQKTFAWDRFPNIWWPTKNPILSERDDL